MLLFFPFFFFALNLILRCIFNFLFQFTFSLRFFMIVALMLMIGSSGFSVDKFLFLIRNQYLNQFKTVKPGATFEITSEFIMIGVSSIYVTKSFTVPFKKKKVIYSLGMSGKAVSSSIKFLCWKRGKRGYFSSTPYFVINWKQNFWSTRYNNHFWYRVQQPLSIFYFLSRKSANQDTKCPTFLS